MKKLLLLFATTLLLLGTTADIMAQDTKYLKDRVDYLTTTNYKLKKRRSRLYKKR